MVMDICHDRVRVHMRTSGQADLDRPFAGCLRGGQVGRRWDCVFTAADVAVVCLVQRTHIHVANSGRKQDLWHLYLNKMTCGIGPE